MPELPLLFFPTPTVANRDSLDPARPVVRKPPPTDQAARIGPKLARLQATLEAKRLALHMNADGVLPEQVLVVETIGAIDRFLSAVKKVEGLEWLSEIEGDELQPEFGFVAIRDPNLPIKSQLYLVATDQRALLEIERLFRLWQNDPNIKFERGLNSLKEVFSSVFDIRPWDVRDRIRESGLEDDWRARLRSGQTAVPFEAELWFRDDPAKRRAASNSLAEIIRRHDGTLQRESIIPEIGYHGILGEIPSAAIAEVLDLSEIELLRAEEMMYLRPVGQCSVILPAAENEIPHEVDDADVDQELGDPLIALFDGLPLTGHSLLNGLIDLDDPDDISEAYTAIQRRHGTFMASLICRGDLDDHEEVIPYRLYVRPIMVPRNATPQDWVEGMPETELPVDLVYRSIRRLFETIGDEAPVAPTVRIINLSIGDRARPYFRGISAWARLLDWAAYRYGVIFVVSGGNHNSELELGTPRADFGNLGPESLRDQILLAVSADTRNRKILSPAESINAVTVGAAHHDACLDLVPSTLIDPYSQHSLPATYSSHGPGFRRSIKPEILLPGGRQLMREKMGTAHANATLLPPTALGPLGQKVAAPSETGETNRTLYVSGTSNAAALATRSAARFLRLIRQLSEDINIELPSEFETVLVKTLLVHGASWSEAGPLIKNVYNQRFQNQSINENVGQVLGYGLADVERAMQCTEQLVTLIGYGNLLDGQAHEFRFPLPPSLSASAIARKLTISLGWFSPVSVKLHKYRMARLWFDPRNDLANARQDADWRSTKRGTIQHEILEGRRVLDFQDGADIVFKVNCRADAGKLEAPVRYGLAVSLEVAEGINLPIYQEVREKVGSQNTRRPVDRFLNRWFNYLPGRLGGGNSTHSNESGYLIVSLCSAKVSSLFQPHITRSTSARMERSCSVLPNDLRHFRLAQLAGDELVMGL